MEEMEHHWPHFDGAIFFNDGYQKSNLCTLPIMGRRLYDQFGFVYEPAYESLFCDREQTDLLRDMGRLVYIDEKIIEHRHHVWGRAPKDELYERNDAREAKDKATWERRRRSRRAYSQFAHDAPAMWVSILICSLPERWQMLRGLVDELYRQIESAIALRQVEVVIDDREGVTVGEKRDSLLKRARGHYIAFVDDDDAVAHDYVVRVISAVSGDLSVDCASLVGVVTTDGANPKEFRHSIEYDGWFYKDGAHRRCPNHLNAVRRDLALQAGFVNQNVGEDVEYSSRLRPLLKKEATTGDKPLYFYFYNRANSVQSK
jgi:hypothetical protein